MFADSKNISIWPPSKLSLDLSSVTAVERQLTQLSKLPHVFHQASLTSSETKIFHALFPVESIKILISEWLGMFAQNWKHLSLQGSTTNSSHHCKDSILRCLPRFLKVEFLWLILPSKSRIRSKSMLSVGEKLQNKSKKSMVQTYPLIFLISIFDFSWKTTKSFKKSGTNMEVERCLQVKSKRFWLKCYKILSLTINRKERKLV